MKFSSDYPATIPCHVPADCFNLVRLVRKRIGGYVEINLPGMSDNTVVVGEDRWKCRNRKLGEVLLTWEDFRNGERSGLLEPVECTLTLHHSYSRTIIWHLYDSLKTAMQRELAANEAESGRLTVLAWPMGTRVPNHQPLPV